MDGRDTCAQSATRTPLRECKRTSFSQHYHRCKKKSAQSRIVNRLYRVPVRWSPCLRCPLRELGVDQPAISLSLSANSASIRGEIHTVHTVYTSCSSEDITRAIDKP